VRRSRWIGAWQHGAGTEQAADSPRTQPAVTIQIKTYPECAVPPSAVRPRPRSLVGPRPTRKHAGVGRQRVRAPGFGRERGGRRGAGTPLTSDRLLRPRRR